MGFLGCNPEPNTVAELARFKCDLLTLDCGIYVGGWY